MATAASASPRWRNDRLFYTAMGVFVALVTIAGFARSYYLNYWFDTPRGMRELTPLLHLHGAAFTAWIALMVIQPLLVANKKRKLHRKLGFAGAAVAAAMVVLGNIAAVEAMNVGFATQGDPHVFYAVPFFGINSFAVTVFFAILWRERAEAHKRLILLSNVAILGAAIARMPSQMLENGAPFTFMFGPFLIVLAGIAYDRVSRGRIHRVWLVGGGAMLATQLAMVPIMTSGPWIAFAKTMAGLAA
jgi:hypothetical protein